MSPATMTRLERYQVLARVWWYATKPKVIDKVKAWTRSSS